jgi:hypothetical protein
VISADTTIGHLLDAHPELVDVLARYHPHFRQLRHRLLRRIMAPRVTVAQAARIAGVETDALLEVLRRAAGEVPGPREAHHQGEDPRAAAGLRSQFAEPARKPAVLAAIPDARLVRLDVREDIREGREPFARIMRAVKNLRDGEVLVLRAPFEPIPLCDVATSG